MIPKSNISTDIKVTDNDTETSKTYKLSDTKIQGYIDQLNALQQTIYKVLNTQKYDYPIYSFSYGIDLMSLIGKDAEYVKIEMKRRIKDYLLKDERIKAVDSFSFITSGDSLVCEFTVTSIYGDLIITKEVVI